LQQYGLGTLLLETPGSAGRADADAGGDAGAAGDADALTNRLLQALEALPVSLSGTPIGLLGCGDGAAAVLLAAARRPDRVRAAVCCAGRFVAADPVLADLRVPTMLIAGAADPERVDEARQVHARLRCEKRIDIVPRASRHFLEAGTLELATERAADWFCGHLAVPG
jgi:putative phosphoribosyl transferase